MAQPDYVPLTPRTSVRVGEYLRRADHWVADRPGEHQGFQPLGPRLGNPGPDQGYALKLARGLQDSLILGPHEHLGDVVAGCVEVAMRRSALYGRAPVIHDVRLAFALFGFLAPAPDDLVAFRRPMFEVAAHSYPTRRAIVDRVPDATLLLTPDAVAAGVGGGGWRALLGLA